MLGTEFTVLEENLLAAQMIHCTSVRVAKRNENAWGFHKNCDDYLTKTALIFPHPDKILDRFLPNSMLLNFLF